MPDDPSAAPNFSPDDGEDDPFAEFEASFDAPDGPGGGGDFGPSGPSATGLNAALALDLARSWVKQHQKATMLGAFATGVLLGSLLRE